MQWTPWQGLLRDREVTEEIQDFLSSRRKFPRMEAATVGRKDMGAFFERQISETTGAATLDERITEAIVLAVGRPSLLIQDGRFEDPDLSVWQTRLNPVRAQIEAVIPSVGRLEVLRHPDFEWLGTAWVIDDRTLVTNRHVAREFVEHREGRLMFRRSFLGEKMGARVDFLEEYGTHDAEELEIQEILYVAPEGIQHPDMALLRLGCSDLLPDPIGLADEDPTDEQLVGVIGYPARDKPQRCRRHVQNLQRYLRCQTIRSGAGHAQHVGARLWA